jgi:hypothetical protein
VPYELLEVPTVNHRTLINEYDPNLPLYKKPLLACGQEHLLVLSTVGLPLIMRFVTAALSLLLLVAVVSAHAAPASAVHHIWSYLILIRTASRT